MTLKHKIYVGLGIAAVVGWTWATTSVFDNFVDRVYRRSVETAGHAFYLGCTIGSLAQDKKVSELKCKAAAEAYVRAAFPEIP